MNEVSFIWATVAVFLLSGLIFTRAKIFLLLLIIWLIRTICLKKLTVVMQALLISVCFLFTLVIKQIQLILITKVEVILKLI